ncbi:hypothetical protein HDU93_004998 [Gonapodya sp. JEL0774]|nr:hypothetical protein HDU93_004998 [Gonapodya sp. JEL0774]
MGLKKLRVEYWDGIKIVVLRDGTLPQTYDDFVGLLCTKIPQIESAAQQYVLRLQYRDADTRAGVHLEEDDDLAVMYETGDSFILNVELEEVRNHRGIKWAGQSQKSTQDNHLDLREPVRSSVVSSQSAQGMQMRQAPRGPNGLPQLSIAPAAEKRTYQAGAPPSPPHSVTTMTQSGHLSNGSQSNYGGSGTLYSTASTPIGTATPSVNSGSQGVVRPSQIAAGIITESAGPKNTEPIVVTVAGKEYVFPLVWMNAARQGTEQVMGVLGKPEWAAQRSWGYKHVKYTDMDFMIVYGPRESSYKKLKGASQFMFTMFFNSRPLFQSALNKYHRKFNTLTPADFKTFLIDPVSQVKKMDLSIETVATEWAFIQPPASIQMESASAGGEYHCCYLIKDARTDLTDLARKRVESWIVTALGDGGCWCRRFLPFDLADLLALKLEKRRNRHFAVFEYPRAGTKAAHGHVTAVPARVFQTSLWMLGEPAGAATSCSSDTTDVEQGEPTCIADLDAGSSGKNFDEALPLAKHLMDTTATGHQFAINNEPLKTTEDSDAENSAGSPKPKPHEKDWRDMNETTVQPVNRIRLPGFLYPLIAVHYCITRSQQLAEVVRFRASVALILSTCTVAVVAIPIIVWTARWQFQLLYDLVDILTVSYAADASSEIDNLNDMFDVVLKDNFIWDWILCHFVPRPRISFLTLLYLLSWEVSLVTRIATRFASEPVRRKLFDFVLSESGGVVRRRAERRSVRRWFSRDNFISTTTIKTSADGAHTGKLTNPESPLYSGNTPWERRLLRRALETYAGDDEDNSAEGEGRDDQGRPIKAGSGSEYEVELNNKPAQEKALWMRALLGTFHIAVSIVVALYRLVFPPPPNSHSHPPLFHSFLWTLFMAIYDPVGLHFHPYATGYAYETVSGEKFNGTLVMGCTVWLCAVVPYVGTMLHLFCLCIPTSLHHLAPHLRAKRLRRRERERYVRHRFWDYLGFGACCIVGRIATGWLPGAGAAWEVACGVGAALLAGEWEKHERRFTESKSATTARHSTVASKRFAGVPISDVPVSKSHGSIATFATTDTDDFDPSMDVSIISTGSVEEDFAIRATEQLMAGSVYDGDDQSSDKVPIVVEEVDGEFPSELAFARHSSTPDRMSSGTDHEEIDSTPRRRTTIKVSGSSAVARNDTEPENKRFSYWSDEQ